MGLVISVTNMKGGVGKTTLTANIGFCLSYTHSKNVLLIDVDPQFNLTQYCMSEDEYEKILTSGAKGTVFDVFIPDSIVIPSMLAPKKKSKGKVSVEYKSLSVNTDNLPKGDKSACKLKKSLETSLLFLIANCQLPKLIQP